MGCVGDQGRGESGEEREDRCCVVPEGLHTTPLFSCFLVGHLPGLSRLPSPGGEGEEGGRGERAVGRTNSLPHPPRAAFINDTIDIEKKKKGENNHDEEGLESYITKAFTHTLYSVKTFMVNFGIQVASWL